MEKDNIAKDARSGPSWTPSKPLVSAAEIDPANYLRGRFDEDLGWFVSQHGKRRSPKDWSDYRHQVGFAGEVVAAAAFGERADWRVFDAYEGDSGYDFRVDNNRVQVKTITGDTTESLKVPASEISSADYFILARSKNPKVEAELIGWAPRHHLQHFGYQLPGDDFVRLDLEYLHHFRPIFLDADRIREANRQ